MDLEQNQNEIVSDAALLTESPSYNRIRSFVSGTYIPTLGVSPAQLQRYSTQADNGDDRNMIAVYRKMEKDDPQYRTVTNIRRRRVAMLDWSMLPASGEQADIDFARDLESLLRTPPGFDVDCRPRHGVNGLMYILQDRHFTGYALAQQIQQEVNGRLAPTFMFADPRCFQFAGDRSREIRLRRTGIVDGEQLDSRQWIQAIPEESGVARPYEGGIARTVAFLFAARGLATRDYIRFLELYGQPIRIAKYDRSSVEEGEVDDVINALATMSSDFSLVVPSDFDVSFATPGQMDNPPYRAFLDRTDAAISKLVLAQSTSTDAASNRSQTQVHQDEMRESIIRPDSIELEDVINRQVIATTLSLNYGDIPFSQRPKFKIHFEKQEDHDAIAARVKLFADSGFAANIDVKAAIEAANLVYQDAVESEAQDGE